MNVEFVHRITILQSHFFVRMELAINSGKGNDIKCVKRSQGELRKVEQDCIALGRFRLYELAVKGTVGCYGTGKVYVNGFLFQTGCWLWLK